MKLNPILPIGASDGKMSEQFKRWQLEMNLEKTITGVGTPEGVIEALPTQRYMGTTGTAGAIVWIKRDADIAGDKTMGWIAV